MLPVEGLEAGENAETYLTMAMFMVISDTKGIAKMTAKPVHDHARHMGCNRYIRDQAGFTECVKSFSLWKVFECGIVAHDAAPTTEG